MHRGDSAWCSYDGRLLCEECESEATLVTGDVVCKACADICDQEGVEPESLDLCEDCGDQLEESDPENLCVACTRIQKKVRTATSNDNERLED